MIMNGGGGEVWSYRAVLLDLKGHGGVQVQHNAPAPGHPAAGAVVLDDHGEVVVGKVVSQQVAAATAEVVEGPVKGHVVVGADKDGRGWRRKRTQSGQSTGQSNEAAYAYALQAVDIVMVAGHISKAWQESQQVTVNMQRSLWEYLGRFS